MDIEIRIAYNPFSKDFINCGESHSISLYNEGKQRLFNEYIRGIILDNILFLRVYYPFEDINSLSHKELLKKSNELLKSFKLELLNVIKKEYGFSSLKIKYNVTNDLLLGLNLVNI